MKVLRFIFRRTNAKRLFLLVGICIYGLIHYHIIRRLDADVDSHLHSPQHRHDENDSDRIQIDRKLAHRLEIASSIDYFACCGAGHRFSKLADAYYVAKQLEFTVRVFFGFCANQEVFSYLFGPRPLNEAQLVEKIRAGFRTGNDMNIIPDMYIKISNEVPGFKKITRYGRPSYANTTACPCLDTGGQRFYSDIELFTDLRDNRFRARDKVDAFRQDVFLGHTVIGLHIRAGNGEEGDFVTKNRTIQDIDRWCISMSSILVSLSKTFQKKEPPLLFVASDTVTVVSRLRTMLEGKMEVVDFQQDRIHHGEGVMFGGMGNVNNNGDECKKGWLDSFTDMMLLSHADVLVAGRPSSFTQSLPMTLTLSTPKSERKVLKSFCEVDPDATTFMCFEDLEDWCCNGNTSFSLHTIQKCDYRRMPQVGGLDLEEHSKQLKFRPRTFDGCIPTATSYTDCLPYEMPDEKSLLKSRKRQIKKKTRRGKSD